MEEPDFATIKKTELFANIEEEQLKALLGCLQYQVLEAKKSQYLLQSGQKPDYLGILITGRLHVIKEDFWGNRNLVDDIWPGEVFAESYACRPSAALDVDIVAVRSCRWAQFKVSRLITTCASACPFHNQVTRNLLTILAKANLQLQQKQNILSLRHSREKLLVYLSSQAASQNNSSFSIALNRQQLADYLSIDRSAMSSILTQLQREGVLIYKKNTFQLLSPTSPKEVADPW